MRINKQVFKIFLTWFLFSYVAANAGTWNQTWFEERVDEYINAGLNCHKNPGLSLAVVKDGKVVLTRGYGHKTLDKTDPVTENTLFGIASLSKSFAATLMLKQIEDNKTLSLSTTLRSLFGRGDLFKSILRSKYATIEDLLAHRIGLPSNNKLRFDDKLTRGNLIDRIKYLSVKGGFRTSFYYSNLMYGLITRLSEILSGKTWEELVTEKLFSPLNMTSSTFMTSADSKDLDLAAGYTEAKDDARLVPVPFEFNRRWGDLCGSGCILSNAVDMSKWMLFNLNQNKDSKYEKVLKSDTLADAHSLQNYISYSRASVYQKPTMPETLDDNNYGLGWRLGHYRGYPMVTHSGSTFGYVSLLTMLPNTNIGVYTAMSGKDSGYILRTNLHTYIADLALGLEPWMNRTTVCTFPEPWTNKTTKSSSKGPAKDIPATRDLATYTGVFKNPAYGTIDVYKNQTSGLLMVKYGYAQFILYPKSTPDQFYAEGFGLLENVVDYSTFDFGLDKNKTVSHLRVPSFETKDPPVFDRVNPSQSRLISSHNGGGTVWISEMLMVWTLGVVCKIVQTE
ncbi:hypothetical protein ACF0H5_022749 [Mactra antiquata]